MGVPSHLVHRGFLRASIAALALLAATGAAAEETVRIPGTKIALPVPAGFALAERFPGLGNEDASASVMVNELPGPYAAVVAGFTDEALAGRGMAVTGREAVEIDGRAATLIHFEQTAMGTTFRKWLGVFGDDESTVMVTATAPSAGAEALAETLRGVVLGARFDREHDADPYVAFGYRFDHTGGLELRHETPTGLVLLPPGVENGVPGEHTMLVAGRTFREVEIDDLEDFAMRRLYKVEQLSDLRGLEGQAVRYGGFPGWEIAGSGRDDGAEVAVYQALLLDDKDYLLLIGTAAPADRLAALATFRQVAASVRRNATQVALKLDCDGAVVLLGRRIGCRLRIEGYQPTGLPAGVEVAKRSLLFDAGTGDGAAFVYRFAYAPKAAGATSLGPVALEFEGRALTSNRVEVRALERPAGDAPVVIGVTPARVAVGEPFDVVVVERGVVLGGVKQVSSVRVGGKPVVTHKKPGPVATLTGNDALEIETGSSTTTQKTGEESERVTFYRATARRPGRLVIDGSFIQGLEGEVEIAPATVEVVEP